MTSEMPREIWMQEHPLHGSYHKVADGHGTKYHHDDKVQGLVNLLKEVEICLGRDYWPNKKFIYNCIVSELNQIEKRK